MDGALDLLERARAGHEHAFESLVDLWGTPVFRLAWLLGGDHDTAAAIARRTFLGCWRDLPSLHSERAFRPWLLATVIEIAREDGFGPASGVLAPLSENHNARVVAALRYGIGLRLGEISDAAIMSLRDTRSELGAAAEALDQKGEDALRRAVSEDLRGVELEGGFFQMVLARALTRTPEATVARALTVPVDVAWRAACSAEGLSAVTGLALGTRPVLEPGDHFRTWGRLGAKTRARFELLVTRVGPPELVTWTARARPLLRPGSIELRFTLALAPEGSDTRTTLALDGIALPEMPALGYADLGERLRPSMHRGLESLAARASVL